MLNDQKTSAIVYKQLFTNEEWATINHAMEDYADFYGGRGEIFAKQVQSKIAKIYELTA
jgi:hypothetical protein